MEERKSQRTQIRKPRLLAVHPSPAWVDFTSNFGYASRCLVQARRARTPVAPPAWLIRRNPKLERRNPKFDSKSEMKLEIRN